MKLFNSAMICLAGAAVVTAAPTTADFYEREEIPLPEGEVMEIGSIALMPEKKIAVTTRRGDLWICEGAYEEDLSKVKWSLFARGLHEPFGMFYQDGWLYLTQRPEITRIKDSNGDGRGDRFEAVAAPWGINGNYHEYNFGTDPDKNGNIWTVSCLTGSGGAASDWRGWAFLTSLDGKTKPICSGVRSPGGIGFNQEGDAFYCDNQGLWNGSSSLKHLRPGGFMGNPTGNKYHTIAGLPAPPEPVSGSRMDIERKKFPDLVPPAVVLPHGKVGQSPTGVIYDQTEGKFGPFAGQVLIGEQTHSEVQRAYLEKVNGIYQGAVWKFLDGYRSGIVPLRLSDDAALFVGTTNRGWAARGGLPFSFERTRWNGKVPFEVHEMRAKPDGFELTFTKPVDPKTAGNKDSYKMAAWTYIYQKDYGSPEVDQAVPVIMDVVVGGDGMSVRLVIDGLVKGHVHHLNSAGLRSKGGEELWHADGYYTLNEIPE
jgi:glucose/arabinose dehydrogenase